MRTAEERRTSPTAVPVRSGPILIAFDGTPSSLHAVEEAAALLPSRRTLVVTVWKAGLGFELIALPASSIGLPPAQIDVSAALEVDALQFENARRAAERAAERARQLGLEAAPLVVADDPETSVAETLLRLAEERDAAVLVVGARGHGPILGGVARTVVRDADRPVLLVRERGAVR